MGEKGAKRKIFPGPYMWLLHPLVNWERATVFKRITSRMERFLLVGDKGSGWQASSWKRSLQRNQAAYRDSRPAAVLGTVDGAVAAMRREATLLEVNDRLLEETQSPDAAASEKRLADYKDPRLFRKRWTSAWKPNFDIVDRTDFTTVRNVDLTRNLNIGRRTREGMLDTTGKIVGDEIYNKNKLKDNRDREPEKV